MNGSRHYSVNEENLPSVTTILKATKSEEKKQNLQNGNKEWVINKLKLFQEKQPLEEAQMHDYLEKFLLG